ncbi:MAG: acyl-CoA dehydrogenase [Planctomycetaceae bacterium]|nr:acyl-CoA dehydrogenase [Planctomycetota bacterium]NUN51632.1 acyl-CoA dehydrogenase [Planctomycetaceae bacterium]
MDFHLTEDQKMIRDAAREFAREVLAPRAAEIDRDGRFPMEEFREAGRRGFAGFLVPEEHGGSAVGNVGMALAMFEINRACASTGVTLSVHNSLVSAPLLLNGTEEQKAKWLPLLASGEVLGAYSLSEAVSGSDAAALRCSAVRDGDHFVVDGTKLWVTSGSHAGLFIVFVRTNPSVSNAKGITALLVEKGTPGFSVGKKEEKMGIRGSSTTELVFENCRVPAANVLGKVDDGFRIAMHTLDGGRIGIASQAVGIAEACLEASVKYAKERRQFGKPIASFQAIQWKIAEMGARIEAARLLVLRAAWLKDLGEPHSFEAAVAKLEASRTANFCGREAVQVHGGAGYLVDFPVERHFRDARITEIYEGTTEIQKLVIARHLLR